MTLKYEKLRVHFRAVKTEKVHTVAERAKQLERQKMQDATNKKELENVWAESERAIAEAKAEKQKRRCAMAQAKQANDAQMKELAKKLEKSTAKFEELEV